MEIFLLPSKRTCAIIPVGNQEGEAMKEKTDVRQGTLGLMVLKTLDVWGRCTGTGLPGASSRSAVIYWP
jgi:hypothetical protein